MKETNFHYDEKSDVLYILIKKGKEEKAIEISPGINVELNSKGEIIGIEILKASKNLHPVIKKITKEVTTV